MITVGLEVLLSIESTSAKRTQTRVYGCGAWKKPRNRTETRRARGLKLRDPQEWYLNPNMWVQISDHMRHVKTHTLGIGKPNAEPNMIPNRQSQPIARRTEYGSPRKGRATVTSQPAAMG